MPQTGWLEMTWYSNALV